jgi:transcriptional regulator with XRE-family HTH domain
MDPETQRLVNLLKVTLRILGVTNREIARRLEISPSYISKLFAGASDLRLDHVIRICRAAGLEPAEFFMLAYPRQPPSGTMAASRLKDVLQHFQPQPATPQKSPEKLEEERLETMLKSTLEKMLSRGNGT